MPPPLAGLVHIDSVCGHMTFAIGASGRDGAHRDGVVGPDQQSGAANQRQQRHRAHRAHARAVRRGLFTSTALPHRHSE
eukprot:502144-Prorocentrum_minimum.AAC.1